MEYLIGSMIIALIFAMFWLIGATMRYAKLQNLCLFNDRIKNLSTFDLFIADLLTGLCLMLIAGLIVLIIIGVIAIAGSLGHDILH